jgi:hypothetical protein
MVGKKLFSLQTLMGKQATGYCWGTNLRAIISACMDPKFHSCFLNWKWQNTHLLNTHLWTSLLGGLLHLLLNNGRDVTYRSKIPCTLKASDVKLIRLGCKNPSAHTPCDGYLLKSVLFGSPLGGTYTDMVCHFESGYCVKVWRIGVDG